MPFPKELKERLQRARTKEAAKSSGLKGLVKAFGSGKAFKETAAAIQQLSLARGISAEESKRVLVTARKQIETGRARLKALSGRTTGAIPQSVARSTLRASTVRLGKQTLPTRGGPLPSPIVDFLIRTSPRGQVSGSGVGKRTPEQSLRRLLGIRR